MQALYTSDGSSEALAALQALSSDADGTDADGTAKDAEASSALPEGWDEEDLSAFRNSIADG